MDAESAYLFRHALLRDAAYELQPPSVRANLHSWALQLIEAALGGRAPAAAMLFDGVTPVLQPHGTDAVALELSEHASRSSGHAGAEVARRLYLRRAALLQDARYQHTLAMEIHLRLAQCTDGLEQAQALLEAATSARYGWHHHRAEELLESALEKFRVLDHAHGQAAVLIQQAEMAREGGAYAKALDLLDLAAALLERVHDKGARLRFRANRAIALWYAGRLDEAEAEFRAAIDGGRAQGNTRLVRIASGNFAGLLFQRGKKPEAEAMWQDALAMHRQARDPLFEGVVLGNLANLCSEAGRYDEAESLFRRALETQRATGNRRSEGITLGNLAGMYMRQQRISDAENPLSASIAILREVGDRRSEGMNVGNLATLRRQQGRLVEARELNEVYLERAREFGDRRHEGYCLCNQGMLLLAQGDVAQARHTWRCGYDLLVSQGDHDWAAEYVRRMRQECRQAGRPPLDDGVLPCAPDPAR